MRELERHAAVTGNIGPFRAHVPRFVSLLALSLDETERRVWRVSQMRDVPVALTDITPSTVIVSGTWSCRVANLNGMGDVPPFLSELAGAADRVRNAIATLGGKDVAPRLGKFAALCQESFDAREPFRFLCEFAEGLDALSAAAEDLPERTAPAPASRGKRAA
jgi:hypothetical protein